MIPEILIAFRNRLLADPNVQRRLSRFPLTRWIARRKAKSLFDLTAGFVYSQILLACIELDLFRRLEAGPRSPEMLAKDLDLPPRSMLHLVRAAAALSLLDERKDGSIALGELGAALVGNPGISSMILHHSKLYADLAEPLEVLRKGSGGQMTSYWPYAGSSNSGTLLESDVTEYSALMASSQQLIADDVLDVVSLKSSNRILDVGGGEGAFLTAALRRWPHLQGTLLDLPAVVTKASRRLHQSGVARRAAALSTDLGKGPYPQDHDTVFLVRVIHDHSDTVALRCLTLCRQALPPGGTLIIAEPMAGTASYARSTSAYFHLYLLAMGSGQPRTPEALFALLREAGFSKMREIRTNRPLIVRVISAQ